MDNDGDMDVLSASSIDDKIATYENRSPVTGIHFNAPDVPNEFLLYNNYPNPFNPTTTISYQLKTNNNVQMTIYDISGQKVKILINQCQNARQHSVSFDASGLASEFYIYKLRSLYFFTLHEYFV